PILMYLLDIKLDNVFVNYVQNEQRLSEIQLGDCGGAVSQDSEFVKESYPIGGDFMRSPETMLGLSWGTPTDVWSFGNAILSLVHGGGYHQFDPGYDGFCSEWYHSFGPFQQTIAEILNPDAREIVFFFNRQENPQKPLRRWSKKEIPSADNKFIRQILKLDPWKRPTVEEILEDEWLIEKSDDTREPIPKGTNRSEDETNS
ncbi:kinase-like domain-containing protein, partial [Bipolaris maydis]|uniref:kinase-like domain-containing protein n=1 Tax=Cochliobolus heterostrophus TaxID=5016 RepID=UPI0024DC3A44